MAEVILENVTKVFPGNTVAVKDFSLTIEDQEVTAAGSRGLLTGPRGL